MRNMCVFVRCTRIQYAFVCRCHPSADIWGDGDLPPGWREISDSSEVYFWHVPTGTTQYHRPVASGNQHTSPSTEPGTEHDPQQETQDSLKPPNEVRGPTDLTHLGSNIFVFQPCMYKATNPGSTRVGFSGTSISRENTQHFILLNIIDNSNIYIKVTWSAKQLDALRKASVFHQTEVYYLFKAFSVV